MAAFRHVSPMGRRFNGAELGAWYASDGIRTAAAEVGHHLRREIVARGVETMHRTYRAYTATLHDDYLDIRGRRTEYGDAYTDRKGVVSGKSVSVRLDLGGRRRIKKKKIKH